jgi:hypothetical protein
MSVNRLTIVVICLVALLIPGCHVEPGEREDAAGDSVVPDRSGEDGVEDAVADEQDDVTPGDGDGASCAAVAAALRSLSAGTLLVTQGQSKAISVPGPHDPGLLLTWSVDAGSVDPGVGWEVLVTAPPTRQDVQVSVVIEGSACREVVELELRVRTDAEIDEMEGCLSETLSWPSGVMPFTRVDSALIGDQFVVVLCLGPDVHAGTEYLPVSMRVRNVGPDVAGVLETRPSCEFVAEVEGIAPPNNLAICDGLGIECDPPFGTETWSSGSTRTSGNFYPRFGMDEYSCGVLETFTAGPGDYAVQAVYHGRLADGTPLVSEPIRIPFAVLP